LRKAEQQQARDDYDRDGAEPDVEMLAHPAQSEAAAVGAAAAAPTPAGLPHVTFIFY
jgi:hypothetical protein